MKNRMALAKATKLVLLMGVVLALTTGAVWKLRPVHAGDPPEPDRARFGMIGLTRGQHIRINIADGDPPDPDRPVSTFNVVLAFVDGAGHVLTNPRTGEPIRKTVTLQNGQSGFLTINGDVFLTSGERRMEVRPVVVSQRQSQPTDSLSPPDPCVPTVEVIDNDSLRTLFVYAGTPLFVNPPDPDRQPQ